MQIEITLVLSMKKGDTIKIKIPISNQWFLAHVIEVIGQTVKAKTLFKIGGQDIWFVDKKNVKENFQKNNGLARTSPTLQRQIDIITRDLK